jgi:hypothetical protein
MPFVDEGGEKWASELRRITVLFVNVVRGGKAVAQAQARE